ncbi:hypothetical protein [Acidisphaera sp. L21]|uniref:cell division protein FtsL n=1 Tax=Acidisphaera sp. L21 TaxID=1641851 RepID=UPI00131C88B5|nr:hypothetical protein [Acidisphaera sp. L21]
MIRPLTCLSLVAALGSGLYLYQEKHRAQLLDRDIGRTVKLAEQSRDRIGLLKAEWALLNEPERLAGLAAQHLQLSSLQPSQFARIEDLRNRLPAISTAPVTPAAPVEEAPVAAATPAVPTRTMMASAQPPAPVSAAAAPAPIMMAPVRTVQVAATIPVAPVERAVVKPSAAAATSPIQTITARPASKPSPRLMTAALKHEADPVIRASAEPAMRAETVTRAVEPQPVRRLFAPVMPAYAPTPVAVHAPTVQTASATAPESAFVGSALGMAHTTLAAPVPMSSATSLGATYGR